ncbi:MAG: hypothetical protein HY270_14350 [Deltaproteobacteria bacterium]|nr:hypothetical protein [Deltaproteobacteria bacterium]
MDSSRLRLLGIGLGAAFVLHAAQYNFLSDDGFIVLRYASNLVAGHGLVFNPGERVEGFSSWLWVLLIAGGQWLGLDAVVFARVTGLVCGLLTLWVTWRLGRALLPQDGAPAWALFAPLIVAANSSFACWAPAGLETTLFSCLVTTTAGAAIAARPLALGVLAALCVLTRPEAVLLVAVMAILQQLSTPRMQWRTWVLAWTLPAAALIGQLAVRCLYYGDLLPNTFYAKTGGASAQWSRGLAYLLDYAGDHEGLPFAIIPVAIGLLGADPQLRLLAGVVVAAWASVVAVGGDGLPMYRFMLPALPVTAALTGVLIERGYRLASTTFTASATQQRIVLGLLIAVLTVANLRNPQDSPHYDNYVYHQEVEVPRWVRAGVWLRDNARPGQSFAAVPIGAVSYYSGLRAYDMLGLTDRHIAHRQMPAMGQGIAGHEKHDGAYILQQRPTYLLVGNINVTSQPRDTTARPFIPLRNPQIAAREADLFDDATIESEYEPRSVRIGDDEYLNFYQLREGGKPANPASPQS